MSGRTAFQGLDDVATYPPWPESDGPAAALAAWLGLGLAAGLWVHLTRISQMPHAFLYIGDGFESVE